MAGFYAEESTHSHDKDGVDMVITKRGPMGVTVSPTLDVQVKSHLGPTPKADPWKYDLKAATYRTLRATPYQVPRILVVMMMPKDPRQWLEHEPHSQIVLRRCAYWRSLVGEPATQNTATIRINMPRSQVLDAAALTTMMQNVATRNAP